MLFYLVLIKLILKLFRISSLNVYPYSTRDKARITANDKLHAASSIAHKVWFLVNLYFYSSFFYIISLYTLSELT